MSVAPKYDNVVKGKLKLKGGITVSKPGIKKKPAAESSSSSSSGAVKRKEPDGSSSSSSSYGQHRSEEEQRDWEERELERLLANKQREMDAEARIKSGGDANAAAAAAGAGSTAHNAAASHSEVSSKQAELDALDDDPTLTKAQRDFARAQKNREMELIQKKIAKTHRQRVEEFNTYLANLSEHNDIPRVGPG